MRVKMEWRAFREVEQRLWSPELMVRRPVQEFTGFDRLVLLRRSFFGADADGSLPFWNPLTGLLSTGHRVAIWDDLGELMYTQHGRFGYWSQDGWRFTFWKKEPLRYAQYSTNRHVILDGQRSIALLLNLDKRDYQLKLHSTEPLFMLSGGVFSFHNLETPELKRVWSSHSQLLWSPDGTRCLEQDTSGQFVLRDISGTELWHSSDLTDQDVNWRSMQWSPDGQRVHCVVHRQITVFDFSALPPDIARYPLSPNQLNDDDFGGWFTDQRPFWAAQGAYLAIPKAHRIHLYSEGRHYTHSLYPPRVGHISMFAPHPHLPLIACGSWDAMIWMLDLEGRVLDEISTDVQTKYIPAGRMRSMKVPFTSSLHPDGTVLAVAYRGGDLALIRLNTATSQPQAHALPNVVIARKHTQHQAIEATNIFLGALVRQNPHLPWTKAWLRRLWKSSCFGYCLELSAEHNCADLKILPSEIGLLTHLRELSLSGTSLEQLPEEIAQLQQLYLLDLQELNLEAWPNALCKLKQLRYLYLLHSNIQELPACIRQLGELRVLNLNETRLHQLPPEIGHLHNLQRLSLIGTQIRSLPAEMAQLKQLKSLHITRGTTYPPELDALFKRLVLS